MNKTEMKSKQSDNGGWLHAVGINKVLCISLIVLISLECILIMMPVIEVKSTLLDQTWSFTLNDLLSDNLVMVSIAILHIVSIICVAAPLLAKRKVEGMSYIVAYATTVLTLCISAVMAISIEDLLTNTLLRGIANIASIEVSTVALYIVVASSLAGVGLSFGSMATA